MISNENRAVFHEKKNIKRMNGVEGVLGYKKVGRSNGKMKINEARTIESIR